MRLVFFAKINLSLELDFIENVFLYQKRVLYTNTTYVITNQTVQMVEMKNTGCVSQQLRRLVEDVWGGK